MGDGITLMNGFHDLGVLIGNPPEDFLPNNFLDLRIRDRTTILMAIEDDLDLFWSNVLSAEVPDLPNQVAHG